MKEKAATIQTAENISHFFAEMTFSLVAAAVVRCCYQPRVLRGKNCREG